MLRQKERIRLNNNAEYHDRVRARAKALYRLKAADIPKLRRGRKPKPKGKKPMNNHYINQKVNQKLKLFLMLKTKDLMNSIYQLIVFYFHFSFLYIYKGH